MPSSTGGFNTRRYDNFTLNHDETFGQLLMCSESSRGCYIRAAHPQAGCHKNPVSVHGERTLFCKVPPATTVSTEVGEMDACNLSLCVLKKVASVDGTCRT